MEESEFMVRDFYRIKSDKFVTIPNLFLQDIELTCKAKGVLSMILAFPDNWNFSIKGMVAVIKEGESALRSAISELKDKGYCVMKDYRKGGRFVKWIYIFSGEKIAENDISFKDFPFLEKPLVENPQMENQAQINIYKGNNKEINKKRLSNDNQKVPDDLFEKFWEAYDNKRSKEPAMKAWKRLTKEEKEAAIKRIPEYKEDCRLHERQMKYPATYLNQKTWQDDFDCDGRVKAEEHKTGDEDRKLWEKQKEWLQKYLPNIAPEITQGVMKEFTNLAICDKHLLQETLEELNKVYDGGDIVERFREILNR